jgi:hypothetical protein
MRDDDGVDESLRDSFAHQHSHFRDAVSLPDSFVYGSLLENRG